MGRTRWWVAIGTVLVVGGLVAGRACGRRPVDVVALPIPGGAVTSSAGPAPRVTVTWLRATGGCAVTSSLKDSEVVQTRRPRVGSDPDTVRLVWIPGQNATRSDCAALATTADEAVAHRLAGRISDSTALPDGPTSCPADLGLGVLVSLHSRVGWQTVQVDTTGCTTLFAPGFVVRRPSRELVDDLRALGPPAWARTAP